MVEMSSNCTKGIINYLSIFAKYFALLLNYMPIKTTKISKQKDKDNNEKGFTLAQRQVNMHLELIETYPLAFNVRNVIFIGVNQPIAQ